MNADHTAPASDLLTTAQLAAWLQIEPATVRQWRYRRLGPAAVKVGGAVRYRRGDVELWLTEHRERMGGSQ